jgi:hypothetical protein
MKTLLFCLLILPFVSMAQNIGIGTLTPDSSAMLDITSTSKGLLAPRLRTVDRLAIVNPADGLLVFDINTLSFWVYRGLNDGGWNEITQTSNGPWTKNGNKIYNTNLTEVVGIGTSSPSVSRMLTLNSNSAVWPGIGFGFNDVTYATLTMPATINADKDINLSTSQGNNGHISFSAGNTRLKLSPAGTVTIGNSGLVGPYTLLISDNEKDPMIQFQKGATDKGFVQVAGDDLKIGTNISNTSGKFIVRTKGQDRLFVSEFGNVGIGMEPGVQASLRISNAWEPAYPTIIQFVEDNISTGWITSSKTSFYLLADAGAKMILGTNGNPRLVAATNGNIGIGTENPGSILTINSENPLLQLQNNSVDKGFIQIVSDDIKVGTNLSNASGSFYVRTNGADRVKIDHNGNMGVGTANPAYRLQVGTAGDGSQARANAWNVFSDERYKTNVEEIPNALDKIQGLHGYYYNWKTGDDTTRQAGLLAQEVEKVLPEIVSTDADGYKSVEYGKMNALLLQALKEQQQQIVELCKKVEQLSEKQLN